MRGSSPGNPLIAFCAQARRGFPGQQPTKVLGYSFRGVRWMVSRRHPPSSNSTLTRISRRIFPFTQKDIVALSDDELVARMDHFPDIWRG